MFSKTQNLNNTILRISSGLYLAGASEGIQPEEKRTLDRIKKKFRGGVSALEDPQDLRGHGALGAERLHLGSIQQH